MIEIKQVSKYFGNRIVLNQLNFELCPGEVVGLVGLNGVGKTTMIRTMCGLCKPESGKIFVDERNLSQEAPLVKAKLGVILHESMLYPNLTCRENLNFYSHLYGLDQIGERINHVLDLMNLFPRSEEKVSTLSRGFQQRLSIARALLHDPIYLLMDEVFTGLDQQSAAKLEELILQQAANGKGILFSTHEIDKVFSIASRVALLNKGKIVFSSSLGRITRQEFQEKYSELTFSSIVSPERLGE